MNKLDKSINENFKKCVNRPVDSLVQNMYTHNMVKKKRGIKVQQYNKCSKQDTFRS